MYRFYSRRWKRGRRAIGMFILLTGILLAGPHSSSGADSSLLRKLDSQYYYPQGEGLERLSFTIHWAQLDPFSNIEDKKLLNNPSIRFHWKAGMAKPDFEMEESGSKVPAERELQILQFVTQYSEIFLPVPLSHKLSGYSLKGKRKNGRFLEARYIADSPQPILQYDFKIDTGRRVIDTLYIKMNHAPFSVTSHFLYTPRQKKWQVAESRARYEVDGRNYEEILEFFYEHVDGFWLPSRIRQQLKEGSRLMQSNVFTFSRFEIN